MAYAASASLRPAQKARTSATATKSPSAMPASQIHECSRPMIWRSTAPVLGSGRGSGSADGARPVSFPSCRVTTGAAASRLPKQGCSRRSITWRVRSFASSQWSSPHPRFAIASRYPAASNGSCRKRTSLVSEL